MLDGDLNTGWQPVEGAGPHERFIESNRRRVTYEIDPQAAFPVHFVRVDVLQAAVGARLLEIEVEAFGDNLAHGMLERGGSMWWSPSTARTPRLRRWPTCVK